MQDERPADLAATPPSRREWAVVVAAYALACVIYATYALLRHARFETAGFDLGIFDQAIWRWSQFLGPENTIRRVPSLFADHFSPVLLLLVPLRWIGLDERGLLIVQPLIACAGAFPIFAFARRRLPQLPALAFPIAYLASWGLAHGLAFDIHEFAFTCLALPLAVDLYDRGAKGPFWLALAFWLLTKEDQGLTVACLGLLALTRRQWAMGAGILAAGVGTFLVVTRVVIPHFAGGNYAHWVYDHLGPTATAAAIFIVTHPITALKFALTPATKVGTLARFLGGYAFLPLFSPYILLLIAPTLALLLTETEAPWSGQYHYWMPLAAAAALAGADGLARLMRWLSKRTENQPKTRGLRAAFACVVIASLLTTVLAKIPQAAMLRPRTWVQSPVARDGEAILARIPPGASVSATNNALGHLGARKAVYLLRYGFTNPFPYPPVRAKYVVVDSHTFFRMGGRIDCHPFADPEYQLVERRGDWFLYVLKEGIPAFEGYRPVEPGTDVMERGEVFDKSARG